MSKYYYKVIIKHNIGTFSGVTYFIASTYIESCKYAANYKTTLNMMLPENMTVRLLFLGTEDIEE